MSSSARLTKNNLPKSNSPLKFSTAGSSTHSEFGSASSATGITSAELTFREMSDHQSRFTSPQKNMSGLTQDSSVASASHPSHSDANGQDGLVPDQYYFNDDFAQGSEADLSQDATKAVHEMHHALLYLMSNTEEYHRAINQIPNQRIDLSSLGDWTTKIYDESEKAQNAPSPIIPLPYIVFASDAEVVLPQAHTASQLFGVETVTGVELEAAAGVPALSQLFLRWLALMPGGDHLNIIDPPGLTVMRISGGRYRVTAAHRVVWTWYNDFLPEALPTTSPDTSPQEVAFGDLVTMTVVDVFETDRDGRLLSYCPTFDNRAVHKTTAAKERLSKETYKMKKRVDYVRQSTAAKGVNKVSIILNSKIYSASNGIFDSCAVLNDSVFFFFRPHPFWVN